MTLALKQSLLFNLSEASFPIAIDLDRLMRLLPRLPLGAPMTLASHVLAQEIFEMEMPTALSSFHRQIKESDDKGIALIIRQVLQEFDAARPGFAFADPELDNLTSYFSIPRAAYWVAEREGKLLGGAGFAPLQGGSDTQAELKKMYLLPEARGQGLGTQLLNQICADAKSCGYTQLYLETLNSMQDAIRLYERQGFVKLPQALGKTGHFGCNNFYLLDL